MNHNISKLFDEFVETINRHDLSKAVTYCDEKVLWRDFSFSEPFTGQEAVKKSFKMWETAFPDFKVRILNKLVADDVIAIEMEFTGTHKGLLRTPDLELTPTNRKVKNTGASFIKFKNGKILQVNDYPDVQGMFVQLGIQPAHADEHRF